MDRALCSSKVCGQHKKRSLDNGEYLIKNYISSTLLMDMSTFSSDP